MTMEILKEADEAQGIRIRNDRKSKQTNGVTGEVRHLPSLGFQLNFCAGMQSADRPRWIT